MSISKEVKHDKIEIVGDHKHLQIREATIVTEDGAELSRSFHRRIITPDADISGETTEIQGVANAVWTDEVKAAWAAYQAAQAA